LRDEMSEQELREIDHLLSNRFKWLKLLPSRHSSANNHRLAELIALISLAEKSHLYSKSLKWQNELLEQFSESTNTWSSISKDYTDNLKLHFNSELNKVYTTADHHSVRVKEMIQKMANIASIQTINI
ncbi:MAG: hypothetical protein ACKO7P_08565, partial [Bacteroidota bacterium]